MRHRVFTINRLPTVNIRDKCAANCLCHAEGQDLCHNRHQYRHNQNALCVVWLFRSSTMRSRTCFDNAGVSQVLPSYRNDPYRSPNVWANTGARQSSWQIHPPDNCLPCPAVHFIAGQPPLKLLSSWQNRSYSTNWAICHSHKSRRCATVSSALQVV